MPVAALVALLLAGCATLAKPPPPSTAWRFNRVDPSDFPDGVAIDGTAKALGSVMLRHAVRTDEAVAELCRHNGLPDAIAPGPDGSTLELAYLRRRVVYTVRRMPTGPSAVTSRSVSDTEAAEIAVRSDSLVLADASSATFADRFARYGRVLSTLRRVVGGVPPGNSQLRPGRYPGFATVAFPLDPFVVDRSTRLISQRYSQDVVVAWVDPQGPVAESIEVGDHIDAVDGLSLASEQWLYDGWVDARTLSLRNGQTTRDVVVTPEEWPFDIRVLVVPQDFPSAASLYVPDRFLLSRPGLSVAVVDPGEILVFVTTGLLERLDDDALAWVLSHELAHVALGHLTKKPSLTDRVGDVLMATALLPTLVVPVAGPAVYSILTETATGARRRSNRDQERDADRLGTLIACRAGIDPKAGLQVMEALASGPQASAWQQFFDIHPPYDERSTVVRQTAAQACP